jgi:hypothetical protein
MYQRQFEQTWDSFATTDETNGYRIPFLLPSGYIWRIDKLLVQAQTNYAAQDTNYETFTLYDSSGNGICAVANGPATGGLAIGAHATGVTTTMTSAYQYIDARAADSYVYAKCAATGSGRAMVGIKIVLMATPMRKGLANLA